MPLIRPHDLGSHVTLINLFTVSPRDQLGLARVQLGDMYWFGKRADGAVSASFHRSLDGERFFNYGQWRSIDALNRNRETPEFQRHLDNYRHFDLRPDPQLYEVVAVADDRPLAIRWPSPVWVSLEVLTIDAGRVDDALASLLAMHREAGAGDDAPLAWAVHRGMPSPRTANVRAMQADADDDGGGRRRRLAVYAQWGSARAHAAHEASAPVQAWCRRHLHAGDQRDARLYEVAGTSDD